jgi:hypothetical protein
MRPKLFWKSLSLAPIFLLCFALSARAESRLNHGAPAPRFAARQLRSKSTRIERMSWPASPRKCVRFSTTREVSRESRE